MSYGIEILTGLGETKLGPGSRVARTIKTLFIPEGSVSSEYVPEYSESRGVIGEVSSNFDSNDTITRSISFSWDEANKTLSWDNSNDAGPAILLMFHYG